MTLPRQKRQSRPFPPRNLLSAHLEENLAVVVVVACGNDALAVRGEFMVTPAPL